MGEEEEEGAEGGEVKDEQEEQEEEEEEEEEEEKGDQKKGEIQYEQENEIISREVVDKNQPDRTGEEIQDHDKGDNRDEVDGEDEYNTQVPLPGFVSPSASLPLATSSSGKALRRRSDTASSVGSNSEYSFGFEEDEGGEEEIGEGEEKQQEKSEVEAA